jgi:septal ring factor EnvC (AmiA/AmiB activator)
MIWNAILSIACGSFVWWVRGISQQAQETKRRIADTREEIAKTYATKADVEKDLGKIMDRFDRLDAKLDSFLVKVK